MSILYTLLLFILLMISIVTKRKVYHITFIFNLFWFLIVFFSNFQFYGLYKPSDTVYLIILLGNIFFFVGSFLFLPFRKKRNKNSLKSIIKIDFIAKLLFVFALTIIIYKIILLLPTILTEGVGESRNAMQLNDSMNLQGIWIILQNYFAKPYIRAFLIVKTVIMFKHEITKGEILRIGFICFVLFLSDGGRTTIINVFIMFTYLIIKYRNILSKINRKKLIIAAISTFSLVLIFTVERGSSILESIYMYYCGSMSYLSGNLNNPSLFNGYTYGFSSLQGLFSPVFGILNLFGIKDLSLLKSANLFLLSTQYTTYYVSSSYSMNYFITCFGYFIKDFGYLGLAIFSTFTGVICTCVDRQIDNIRWVSIKILFVQGVLFTMSKFMFCDYIFVMTLVYIIFMTRNHCVNI